MNISGFRKNIGDKGGSVNGIEDARLNSARQSPNLNNNYDNYCQHQ